MKESNCGEECEENCLNGLKEDYKEIQKKYELPGFDELNEDFNIEKLAELETDYLLREIRKFMADKFSNYLRFIETILNPANAPMFVFSLVKTLESEDRKKLSEVYKKLAKKEVEILGLDIKYSEEKEAEFVKGSYEVWQEMKKDLLEVVKVIEDNWDKEVEINGKGKNYFG